MSEEEKSQRLYREACSLIRLIESHGYQARFAGGCVRDRLLGLNPKDFDIATSAQPQELIALLKDSVRKVVPTGVEFGTVTIVMKFGHYEVTTLRTDKNPDGRHADVEFTDEFIKDAARRDFTINSMFEDADGKIYDYFNGQDDLQKKRLSFVGESHERIKEDYLRIMRLFRFWARFEFTPDPETLQAIQELASGLSKISQERMTSELDGILSADHPYPALKLMFESQIINMMIPEAVLTDEKVLQDTCKISGPLRSMVRLAILLKTVDDPKHLEAICRKLKLSNQQGLILEAILIWGQALAHVPPTQANFMALIDQCDEVSENFFLSALVPAWLILFPKQKDIINKAKKTEEVKGYLRRKNMPLASKDLMLKLNLLPGPKLGEVKNLLIEGFRNEQWETEEQGLIWISEEMQKREL